MNRIILSLQNYCCVLAFLIACACSCGLAQAQDDAELHEYDKLGTEELRDYYLRSPESVEEGIYLIVLIAKRYSDDGRNGKLAAKAEDVVRVVQMAKVIRSEIANKYKGSSDSRKTYLAKYDAALTAISTIAASQKIDLKEEAQPEVVQKPVGEKPKFQLSETERKAIEAALKDWLDKVQANDYVGFVRVSRPKPQGDKEADDKFTAPIKENAKEIIAQLQYSIGHIDSWYKEKEKAPFVNVPTGTGGSVMVILITPNDGPKLFGKK